MKKMTILVAGVVAMLGFALASLAVPAYADAKEEAAKGTCAAAGGIYVDVNTCNDANGENIWGGSNDLTNVIHIIINVMLFIVGILSVIMIIFGGIRYTISTGDKTRVDSAKNTIIYAVVGLVVAIVAFALVQWVFNSLSG
jgi:hypothetical protein